MTQQELQKLADFKNEGWKFTHLSGSKMIVNNEYFGRVVEGTDGTTSDNLYKKCFNIIEVDYPKFKNYSNLN